MSKSKKTPLQLLDMLQKLNPDASPAELKELMSDKIKKDREHFMQSMFDDLFADFERETGCRGPDALEREKLMSLCERPCVFAIMRRNL